MKLHSQLTESELQELHANTIEMMGGLPERQVFNCECGKQFLSYESFRAHNSKEHNIGLPSTYEAYRKCINNNHSTAPKIIGIDLAKSKDELSVSQWKKMYEGTWENIELQNQEYKPGDKVVLLDGHQCAESFVNQEKIFTFVRYSRDKDHVIIENKSGYENITTTKTIAPYTENKAPKFNYKIPYGNYIAMDECGRWCQYKSKPVISYNNSKAWSGCSLFGENYYIGMSAERSTPPWHNWKDSLFYMGENGLVKIND